MSGDGIENFEAKIQKVVNDDKPKVQIDHTLTTSPVYKKALNRLNNKSSQEVLPLIKVDRSKDDSSYDVDRSKDDSSYDNEGWETPHRKSPNHSPNRSPNLSPTHLDPNYSFTNLLGGRPLKQHKRSRSEELSRTYTEGSIHRGHSRSSSGDLSPTYREGSRSLDWPSRPVSPTKSPLLSPDRSGASTPDNWEESKDAKRINQRKWKNTETEVKKIESVKRLEEAEGSLEYKPTIHHGLSRSHSYDALSAIRAGGKEDVKFFGDTLGIPGFADMNPVEQEMVLENDTANMHLGPPDKEWNKPKGARIDRTYMRTKYGFDIEAPPSRWYGIINDIVVMRGKKIYEWCLTFKIPLSRSDLITVSNCYTAPKKYQLALHAKKYHLDELAEMYYLTEVKPEGGKIDEGYNKDAWTEKVIRLEKEDFRKWLGFAEQINDDRIDETLCVWERDDRDSLWTKYAIVLEEDEFQWRLWLAQEIDKIWPSINKDAHRSEYLGRQHWGMNCAELPLLDLKSIRHLGGLPDKVAQEAIDYISKRLDKKNLGPGQRIAIGKAIARHSNLQEGNANPLDISQGYPKVKEKILEHSRNFFLSLTERDVSHLVAAYWEGPGKFTGRFSIWGERSLDERPLSQEMADEWEKGINGQIGKHPKKNEIKQTLTPLIQEDYPDIVTPLPRHYQGYVHNYIRSFTQIELVGIKKSPRQLAIEVIKRKGRFSDHMAVALYTDGVSREVGNLLIKVMLQSVRSQPDKGEKVAKEIKSQTGQEPHNHIPDYIDGFITMEDVGKTPRSLAATIRRNGFEFTDKSSHPLFGQKLSKENGRRLRRAIYHDIRSLPSKEQEELTVMIESTFGKKPAEHVDELVKRMISEESGVSKA